jgi:hypothetical protein
MTDREQEIYKGLKSIGPEIAAFFSDAVKIAESDFDTKPYLLSHLSREIESGLRDILTPKNDEEAIYCDKCSSQINRKIGHKESIIKSLGLNEENEFVKKWHKTANQFPKYAHRHGAWKSPREKQSFDDIWRDFVDILEYLVGSYYALAERIDSIVKMDKPTEPIMKSLKNIFETESRYVYFFSNLKSIEWLQTLFDEGYFDGKLNPEPILKDDDPNLVSIPYWSILNYLEHVSQINAQNPNDEISALLVSIINIIVSYRKPDGNRIENFRTDSSIFKIICNLPGSQITKTHLDFVESTFDSKWEGLIGYDFGELIDRLLLLANKELLLNSISILLKFKIDETKPFDKISSIFRDYDFGRIISEYKEKLIPDFGKEIMELSIRKIKEIINIDISSFNGLTIPTIEEHSQTMSPEKYECQLVYLVRDCIEKLPAENIREILIGMLNEEHPIFKRIALHVIRERYSEFSDLFWNWNENPLAIPLIKHELYELLKQNAKEFTDEKIELVLNWIESKQYYTVEDFNGDAEQMNKVNAYRKKEWISSLLDTGNELVLQKFEELDAINNSVVDHPGFDSWFSSSYGTISPLSHEEVEQKSIEELIVFTKDYLKEKHDFMGDSAEGLSFIISSAVSNNFLKYISDCNALIEAPYIILYAWMNGLNDVLRDEKDITTLTEVFTISNEIFSKQEFWEIYNGEDRYSKWFVSSFLRFVDALVSNDSINLLESDLEMIKTILFEIHKNDNSKVDDFNDLPNTVLNNTKGKIYSSLFGLSLRKARMEQKEEERWDVDIKGLITSEISSGAENSLLFCVLGQYLPNICFLDANWLKQYYPVIFSWNNPINWHAIMTGYLYFHKRHNSELFGLLCANDDYELAIIDSYKFKESAITNIVNQLCGAYLKELEGFSIESPLMQSLISSNNKSIISSYTYFFWSPNETIPEKYIEKIKVFWKSVFDHSKELKNPEIDKLKLSGGFKWLKAFNEIDEELYKWLMLAAPHLEQTDKYFAFENLQKHVNMSPEKVGNILVEIFNHGIAYDISRGKIATMVQVLYDNGLKEIADKICNMHGEKGIHFLRDVFERNNKK